MPIRNLGYIDWSTPAVKEWETFATDFVGYETTEATTTRVNFISNMPSARYCAGLVIHSVTPLMTWNPMAIHMPLLR